MRKLSAVVLSMALVFNSMSMVSAGTEQDANDAYETSTQVENPWAELLGSGEDGTIENVTEENEQVLENPWEDLFEDETTTEEPTTEEPTTEEPTTEEPTTQEPTTEEPTTQEPTTEEPTTQSQELSIVTEPTDKTVANGATVTLTVGATGNGLKYQWQMSKDGGITWANSASNGNKTASLSFTANEATHGRQFRCIVVDASGKSVTSRTATVYIDSLVGQIVITSQPQDKVVSMGDRVSFTVGAAGNGLKYQWQMSKDGGSTWSNSSSDGYNTPSLSFVVAEAAHGRMFRCVVSDNNGKSVESNGALVMIDTLKDSLMVIAQPQSKTVTIGQRASLTVGATGHGLKYQWQMSKDGGLTWQNSSSDGYNTPNLSFVVAEAAHGRMFRCVVTDQNGESVESEGAVVMVDTLKDTLMVISNPQPKEVSVASRAEFTVGATGNGLKYQWQMSKDGGLSWQNSTSDGYNTAKLSFVVSEAAHG